MFTFALLKNGVNMKPNMMEDEPYRMNKRNRRKRLAFWNTVASGSRMMQMMDSSSTYTAYTENQDSLQRPHREVSGDNPRGNDDVGKRQKCSKRANKVERFSAPVIITELRLTVLVCKFELLLYITS